MIRLSLHKLSGQGKLLFRPFKFLFGDNGAIASPATTTQDNGSIGQAPQRSVDLGSVNTPV
jgi:hypothetical protein